jgi:hypothetical protein
MNRKRNIKIKMDVKMEMNMSTGHRHRHGHRQGHGHGQGRRHGHGHVSLCFASLRFALLFSLRYTPFIVSLLKSAVSFRSETSETNLSVSL